MSLKPVCVPCKRFFRVIKTCFYFLEGMPSQGALPGTATPELWSPYKVWSGDKWKCEGCGTEIVSGFGRESIAVQHEKEFERMVESLNATQFQVNDC